MKTFRKWRNFLMEYDKNLCFWQKIPTGRCSHPERKTLADFNLETQSYLCPSMGNPQEQRSCKRYDNKGSVIIINNQALIG